MSKILNAGAIGSCLAIMNTASGLVMVPSPQPRALLK